MGEIVVVPKSGQGHLFPCMQLCTHLLRLNFRITVLSDSDISSSVPLSLSRQHPLFQLHLFPNNTHFTLAIDQFLRDSPRPVCAVIDHIMNKTQEAFWKFDIPTVIFITSGAAWAAVQHAAWAVSPADMKPGESRPLPGLPQGMVLTYSDLKQRRHWAPPGPHFRGPPLPGEPAPWVQQVQRSAAILINTCDDLERPFLDYVSGLTRKPVWGVGPLLPEQFWKSGEGERAKAKKESNYTEEQVVEWMESKPAGSVMYVSFGSEVGPSAEEYPELARALEQTTRPFIWVIQRGSVYVPEQEMVGKVGERGMVIQGWAPQLVILAHPATGGFLTHCGWNSTVEGIVRGVPLLAWPIRGDQYYNAKLVVSHLRVGWMVSHGYPADVVTKDDIQLGMDKILSDDGIKKRSALLRNKFANGFPDTSIAALQAFRNFINTPT